MKQFIKTVISFLLFLVFSYLLFLFIWGNCIPQLLRPNLNYPIGSYGHMRSRLIEVKQIRGVDVLFLGSSHAYRGFDTRAFEARGVTSFNLGSSAQTPIQTKVLLQRYLDQINPRLIVYAVFSATFAADGVESSLDIIANDKIDLYSIKMACEINNVKVYNTLIYGLLRNFFGLNSSYVEPKVRGEDTYISGGYVERKLHLFRNVEYPQQKIIINERQLSTFEEIVLMIKNKGIKLILVNAPVTTSLYSSYLNNHTFDSIMSAQAKYYNFNEILNLNDSLHFYDSNHLNQNGVELFDNKLIELLFQRPVSLTYENNSHIRNICISKK